MTETTLGQRIAQRRKMLSLSQEAFGEKMGVSRQAAFKWESDTSIPEVEKLINMSRLFGVSVGWLLGEETPEQPTDEDPVEMSEQIQLTFQLPEPEPEQSTPLETPQDAVIEPAPEAPRKGTAPWLTIIFAAVASIGLICSVFSLWTLNSKLQQTAEANTALQEQLAAQSTQITDLEDLWIMLNERVEDLRATQKLSSFEVTSLQDDLRRLVEAVGDGTILPDSSTSLPTYDNLETWSLTAEMEPGTSTVNLQFTATASVDITAATLVVVAGDSTYLDSEIINNICTVSGREISKTFKLPADNEYRYRLDLTLANGIHDGVTLEGHGLENLAELSQPTIRSTPRSVHVFPEKLYFSQGWFNIYLAVPYLAPQDANYLWGTPKICYYHNGELVEEYTPNNAFHNSAKNDASLSFEVYSSNYQMPRFTENDTHELRLEGTLVINGTENDFSIPLRSWQIRQGEFVSTIDG